jgi:hypothetical protein
MQVRPAIGYSLVFAPTGITMNTKSGFAILLACIVFAGPVMSQANKPTIDPRSYNLGIMGGFAEVVRLGVKKLALSEVMTPEEMDGVMEDAQIIATRNDVLIWRETDFLVTDLYPQDVAEGKHVLLIYTGNTLDEYLALKADKAALVASNRYEGQAREDIARRFGQLLSYPQEVIDNLLKQQASNR